VFGQNASTMESTNPGFLQKRNDYLASNFANQGITDQQTIFTELEKNPQFAGASIEDKQNTARAIYERIGQQQPIDQTGATTDDYFNQLLS